MSQNPEINKLCKNDDGQTMVEYILLMFVMVVVITAGMGKFKDWFLGGSGNCTPQTKTFICRMDQTFNQTFSSYDSLRRFVIRK